LIEFILSNSSEQTQALSITRRGEGIGFNRGRIPTIAGLTVHLSNEFQYVGTIYFPENKSGAVRGRPVNSRGPTFHTFV
jgi:hypothetical protein